MAKKMLDYNMPWCFLHRNLVLSLSLSHLRRSNQDKLFALDIWRSAQIQVWFSKTDHITSTI